MLNYCYWSHLNQLTLTLYSHRISVCFSKLRRNISRIWKSWPETLDAQKNPSGTVNLVVSQLWKRLNLIKTSQLFVKLLAPLDVYHSKEQTQNALKSIAALTTGFMGGLVGAPIAQKESLTRFTAYSPPTHNTNRVCGSAKFYGSRHLLWLKTLHSQSSDWHSLLGKYLERVCSTF